MQNTKISIIGAGPAGISAAIQLKRYGLDPIIFEADEIGGLLRNANLVENYPGFPFGISGPKLMELFKKHLDEESIEVKQEKIISIEYHNDNFILKGYNSTQSSSHVIVAAGTVPISSDIPIIDPFMKSKVYYEVHHLLDVKNKRIVIIGAGDAAFDYAINLSRFNFVMILNRAGRNKCLPLLWARSRLSQNIAYLEEVEVMSIDSIGGGLILNLKYRNPEYPQSVYSADYLLIAIGREPELSFLDESLIKEKDNLIADKRLYFIGDVANGRYRQVAIAAGDGIKAAMQIYNRINLHLSPSND